MARALHRRAAGGELAEVEHEPERQLHRRRQSLDDRLELETQDESISQEPAKQQEANEQRPEPIEEAWVITDEAAKPIIGRMASESESDEEVQDLVAEGAGEWYNRTMDVGNGGCGYEGPRF